jgi:hypothetical protein
MKIKKLTKKKQKTEKKENFLGQAHPRGGVRHRPGSRCIGFAAKQTLTYRLPPDRKKKDIPALPLVYRPVKTPARARTTKIEFKPGDANPAPSCLDCPPQHEGSSEFPIFPLVWLHDLSRGWMKERKPAASSTLSRILATCASQVLTPSLVRVGIGLPLLNFSFLLAASRLQVW